MPSSSEISAITEYTRESPELERDKAIKMVRKYSVSTFLKVFSCLEFNTRCRGDNIQHLEVVGIDIKPPPP